jgi:Na+/melibiose symporter-like transporter
MIIVFGILYWIGFLLTFWRSKGCEPSKAEYEAKKAREKKVAEISSRSANLGHAYKAFFTNRNGWAIFLSILFGYCYMFLVSGMMFYYFNYTQLQPGAMGSFMSIRGVVALIGSVFWVPILLKLLKNNKKITMVVSYFIAAATMFLPYLPPVRFNFVFFYVISMICSLLGAGGSMLQVGVLADVGAELSYKHNKDLNNYTISFLMLPLKLSLILRSALITGVLGITGYTAWLADGQPDAGLEAVRNGFSLGYCVIPAILAAIAGLAMLIIYKLPEEKAHEYVMANKKAAEENEARVNAILAERGEL